MKNVAVILAGGKGIRLGDQKPKQFIKVAGKMVIEHTIDVYQKHPKIDEIFIVVNTENFTLVENLVTKNQFFKVKKILIGGVLRSDSSMAAINALDEEVNIILQDANRPLVNDRTIDDCVDALKIYNAVGTSIPATDTIFEIDNGFISSVPDRSTMRRAQSPQAFKLSIIKKAFDLASQDPSFSVTDDCGVVKTYLPEEKIYLIKGEEFNMKITYEEDLDVIEKLFQLRSANNNKKRTI